MDTTQYRLRVTFTTPILGTQPQKDIAVEYLMSKVEPQETADELDTLPEALEKGTTAFHKLNGKPIYYDYHIRGFLKNAGSVFNGLRGVRNLRSKVENLVFVKPRQIELHLPDGGEITFCQRSLRAMTAQGPRTSIARSEQLPAGTWFECVLNVYDGPISEALLRDLLSYGENVGFGQWRNGSYGQFGFELKKME